MKSKIKVFLPALFFCIILYYNIYDINSKNINNIKSARKKTTASNYSCKLKLSNPWHPTILKYMISQSPDCDGYNLDLIYIENDLITLNKTVAKPRTSCEWKCRNHNIGKQYDTGEWMPMSKRVNCEIFIVRCFTNGKLGETYYKAPQVNLKPKFLPHQQPVPSKENSFDNESLFNVHILVLDSVSRSHAIRAIPKTINYLIHELSAFDFHYFNKVGFNSNPNGYAAFVGKHAPNPMITPHFAKLLFDSQFYEKHYIGNIFERSEIPSLLNEDVFSIFATRDFTENVKSMHMLYPAFQGYDSMLKKCFTFSLNHILKYWSQFISAYGQRKPKFSMNWCSRLSHDNPGTLFAGDNILMDFMIKHKEELDNSFLIVMADHGSMFGYHRFEDVMAYEDNNPMLFISLPKALRNDEALNSALKANTQKLVTQYDIYATLIEIASKLGVQIRENLTLHGQSLFKEVPSERNCYTLGISPVYCLCRFDEIPLPSEDPLHSEIVRNVIFGENTALIRNRNNCSVHSLDPNFEPQIFQTIIPNDLDYLIFKVTFQTKYYGDYGRWWTYVYVDKNRKKIRKLEHWHRIDPYHMKLKNQIETIERCNV